MKKFGAMLMGLAVMISASPAFASTGSSKSIEDPAVGWDHLWHELMIDIFIIGILFGGILIVWLLKYKSSDMNTPGQGPTLSTAQSLAWGMIPVFIFMADDFFLAAKGWALWNTYRTVPENATEIKVNAYQWGWDFDYGDGVTTDVLNVPAEKPVVLRMTSEDVIHSFFLPKYRVKEDVMPGRTTYIWFLPHTGDKTLVTCTEFCGTAHAGMAQDVVAMSEKDYNAWLAGEKGLDVAPAAEAGAEAAH